MKRVVHRIRSASATHWLIAAFVLSNLLFATAQTISRAELRRASENLATTQDLLRQAQLDRRHLFHKIASIPLEGEFLTGTLASDAHTMKVEKPQTGIYYLMNSSCGVCPRNYDFLVRASKRGLFVVGLAPNDNFEALRGHVARNELSLPVLYEPGGALMDMIPLYGTPLTLVFRGSELVHLRGGVLTSEDQEVILALADDGT